MTAMTLATAGGSTSARVLGGFHPVVATWFAQRFPDGPTEAQAAAWPLVRAGRHVLVASPTGSGKTLAAFLVAIDDAYWEAGRGERRVGTSLVYVSPLKALAVDIHQNLEVPLAELAAVARDLGLRSPELHVGVRTGDTTPSARDTMVRHPPRIVVTTPESLYLMLTGQRSRQMLSGVRTVVVDEIHALARDKRGSHLALSLQRLAHLGSGRPLQRIGLSATQQSVERMAELLTGAGAGRSRSGTAIVDRGSQRALDLRVELPDSALEAVASTEQVQEVVDRLAVHIEQHRTTLVFVNTRRMSERLARLLGDRLGPDQVVAHHGSLSADRRSVVEHRLRAGDLRALVATASLELGIDIGPVELVCQLGSPRSISTFVQRVGRSNHHRGGVPRGIVFPLTRDELVECVALVAAARAGRLDAVEPPVAPLDILLQQVVAEVAAAGEWDEEALFELVRGADPYRHLDRAVFDEVLALAADGVRTGHGRRMAYLHRDKVEGVVRPRPGARLAASTSGGAIPDTGDYRVLLDPDDAVLGSVNEDFAVESMVGDVFVLGTHSWRIRRVEPGTLRVVDAEGAAPTIPFWTGEAPSRSRKLSEEICDLRRMVGTFADRHQAVCEVTRRYQVDAAAAEQVVDYLLAARAQLGVIPTTDDLVFERFFDESGAMQLVVHAPFGGRITRALGLALRKRFCATFDFELQAAASDDSVLLSLGVQHSFPLGDAPRLLRGTSAPEVLAQAVLTAPMFPVRWRHTLTRSLAVLRHRGGRRNPLPIQRMESDDLMAAVFPALAACQENTGAGPLSIPDHLLVRETLDDCLHGAMDVDGLVGLLTAIENGHVRTHLLDATEPSVLASEILAGKPFTFLDDAPLEERRARAVPTRRGLPEQPGSLARLRPEVLDEVAAEVSAAPRTSDELYDLLFQCVLHLPVPACQDLFEALVARGRASRCRCAGDPTERWWVAERRPWIDAAFPDAELWPDVGSTLDGCTPDADAVATDIVDAHLARHGPTTVSALSAASGLSAGRVSVGLARLEAAGSALQGQFDDRLGDTAQWCCRPVLARVHARARRRLRADAKAVTAQDFVAFLVDWQHLSPPTRRSGRAGLLASIVQLQGFEAAAAAWEDHLFPSRVETYHRAWLDDLCQSGRVSWGRLGLRSPEPEDHPRRGAATPSRSTPISFTRRTDLPWLLSAARGDLLAEDPAHGAAAEILAALRRHGASFHSDLAESTRRLPADVEAGVWDLVARGLVTADGFQAVRSLLDRRPPSHGARARRRRRLPRFDDLRAGSDGRWSLLPQPADQPDDELGELVARQLLARWGVVFWDVTRCENLALAWRHVLRALRRLEDRGEVCGGRFVTGFAGEQFADPSAVAALRGIGDRPRSGPPIRLNATDPLNVAGLLLPGPRIPAVRTRHLVVVDGLVHEP